MRRMMIIELSRITKCACHAIGVNLHGFRHVRNAINAKHVINTFTTRWRHNTTIEVMINSKNFVFLGS